MNKAQQELILEVVKQIDEDRHNPILTLKDYDVYLTKIFKLLCEAYTQLEGGK